MSIDIPYSVEPRPGTGFYNGKLGMVLFLASEVMLFGALLSSYVLLRTGAESWPAGRDVLSVPLGTVNTMILFTSSFLVVKAVTAIRVGNAPLFRILLGTTVLLGVVFLAIKGYEYGAKFHHGIAPATSTFFAIYFTLTGLHGLHLLGGVAVNAYLAGPGLALWKREPARFANRVEVAGMYWHFVDLVWLCLFPTLYLL